MNSPIIALSIMAVGLGWLMPKIYTQVLNLIPASLVSAEAAKNADGTPTATATLIVSAVLGACILAAFWVTLKILDEMKISVPLSKL